MFTKRLLKLAGSMGITKKWCAVIILCCFFLSFFLLTPSLAMAYPVAEDGEPEETGPNFASLARFLKDVRYARKDICDYRLVEICQDIWDINGPENAGLSCFGIAVISVESQFDESMVGDAGDTGLMQVIPKWHEARMERLGVTDISDPHQNLVVGMDYLDELVKGYNDYVTALIHYNAGPSAVSSGAVPPKTQIYVEEVIRRFDVIWDFWEKENA